MSKRLIQPCDHTPEAHVIYDKPGSGYRTVLWCRCRKVLVECPKVRERVADAEADGRAMMALAKPRRSGLR